jgi:hypothetical protein
MPTSGLQVYVNRAGLWKSVGHTSIDNTFVLGYTRPTSANSGIAAKGLTTSDLTIVTGDQNYHNTDFGTDAEYPGMGVIRGKYFKGFITVTPSTRPLAFVECYFEGRTFTYNMGVDQPPANGLAWANGTANPLHFYYCTGNPIQPSYGLDGFGGSALGTAFRCDISRVEDGLYYLGYPGQTPWVDARGNYVHHLSFWDNDPQRASDSPPGHTHNDCLQCSGSLNGVIRGNSFQAFADSTSGMPATNTGLRPNGSVNSASMLTISSGPHQNLTYADNWIAGGIAGCVQMPYQSKTWESSNSWTVSNNRVDPSMPPTGSAPNLRYTFFYCGLTMGPALTDFTGSSWDVDGPTVPSGLGGTTTGIQSAVVGSGTSGFLRNFYFSATRLPGT